jgi:hypothetical protein
MSDSRRVKLHGTDGQGIPHRYHRAPTTAVNSLMIVDGYDKNL